GHACRLVEVVDAPHQAPVRVAPGAEVLNMNVPDREHARTRPKLGADLKHGLGPAPVRGAQEGKGARAHLLVLALEILLDHLLAELLAQPLLVGPRRVLDPLHGALPGVVPALRPEFEGTSQQCGEKERAGQGRCLQTLSAVLYSPRPIRGAPSKGAKKGL